MPDKVEKEEREEGDAEDGGQADKKDKTRQHDSGAADLEKVPRNFLLVMFVRTQAVT